MNTNDYHDATMPTCTKSLYNGLRTLEYLV